MNATIALLTGCASAVSISDRLIDLSHAGFRLFAGMATIMRPLPSAVAQAACCTGPQGTGPCSQYGFACDSYRCWTFGGCSNAPGFCYVAGQNCWSSTTCTNWNCCDCSCVNFDTGFSTYCYCDGAVGT